VLLSHFPGLFYFMKRDSVIFYRSFYESIQTLDLQIQAEVYNAIFEYSLNHVEPDLTGVPLGFFTLIKPQLDANHQRFINGNKQKNKRSGSETEAKGKQKESERQANANVNVNVNDNVNDNVNEIQKPSEKNYGLDLPEVSIGAAIQYFQFARQQVVPKDTILGLWAVFKKKNFTGQKFYNCTKDIFTHFINDLKYQKITDGTKPTTTADKQSAIRKRIMEEGEALYAATYPPANDNS
jgi:hypothetical protein